MDDVRPKSCLRDVGQRFPRRRNGSLPSSLCVCSHGSRNPQDRYFNVTDHPTADWALQQFREVTMEERSHRFVIHDRDSIYSPQLDSALEAMGLKVLKTPFQAPQAKDYDSHCTSWVRCDTTSFARRRCDSFTPWAFRGGLSPGCSYRQSFLSLHA